MLKIKNYFDMELKTVLVYTVLGVISGYISFLFKKPLVALVFALIVLVISSFALKNQWKMKHEIKWWLGNAGVVFLMTWFITYTIFYNTGIV